MPERMSDERLASIEHLALHDKSIVWAGIDDELLDALIAERAEVGRLTVESATYEVACVKALNDRDHWKAVAEWLARESAMLAREHAESARWLADSIGFYGVTQETWLAAAEKAVSE